MSHHSCYVENYKFILDEYYYSFKTCGYENTYVNLGKPGCECLPKSIIPSEINIFGLEIIRYLYINGNYYDYDSDYGFG